MWPCWSLRTVAGLSAGSANARSKIFFNVDPNDFNDMVNRKQIQKFSVTSRQVIVYLGDVRPGAPGGHNAVSQPDTVPVAQASTCPAPAMRSEWWR